MTSDQVRTELARQFSRQCESVAAELERVAATVRTKGSHIIDVQPTSRLSAAKLAADIMHEVHWGLANATVHHVITAASDFDSYLRTKVQQPAPVSPAVPLRSGPVQPGDIRVAIEEISDLQAEALLTLAKVLVDSGDTAAEADRFAFSEIADALADRGLLTAWIASSRPTRYRFTLLGRAVSGRLVAGQRALRVTTEHGMTEGS